MVCCTSPPRIHEPPQGAGNDLRASIADEQIGMLSTSSKLHI